MEDMFSTLVGLIPIAAIIAIRIFASRKRNEQSRAAPQPVDFFEDRDEEQSFRPHWETDDTFRSDSSPFPKPVSKVRKQTDNTAFLQTLDDAKTKFMEQIRTYEERLELSPEKEAGSSRLSSSRAAPKYSPPAPKYSSPAPSKDAPRAQDETKTQGSNFEKKLEPYTPLQQAVIMAEILGPPKGFA
jgi:hypothetical protein